MTELCVMTSGEQRDNMAPVSDTGGGGRTGDRSGGLLSLDDCRCPVCLEIFLEPVTLPCTHTFCKGCFLESVDKATLCCPMCRKRVSTWARLNSRKNTLVNQQLWHQIQTSFPLQCERRQAGQEDEDSQGVSVSFPTVYQPGELRQEYEDQVIKLTEEKRVEDEEERRASEAYIQQLLAEEQQLLLEESRRREEDERLARQLNNQLNSAPVSHPAEVTPAKVKKVVPGHIERFFGPVFSKTALSHHSPTSTSTFMANKENIILSEVEPQVECLTPKVDHYGVSANRLEPPDLHPSCVEDPCSQLIGDRRSPLSKRKSPEQETTEEEVIITKEGYQFSSLEVAALCSPRNADWESELLSRRQQEEDDRQLALLLQKELDQEEKQRVTNRRKGSADAYPLRQNRGRKVETHIDTPRQPSTKTAKTSSPSPSSSSSSSSACSRGSKQTIITDMFASQSG